MFQIRFNFSSAVCSTQNTVPVPSSETLNSLLKLICFSLLSHFPKHGILQRFPRLHMPVRKYNSIFKSYAYWLIQPVIFSPLFVFIFVVNNHFLPFSALPRREWHQRNVDCSGRQEISIHTPKKGVTMSWQRGCRKSSQFQSTLPRREWRTGLVKDSIVLGISIHTPKKGVTSSNDFSDAYKKFQSTLPRREWPVLPAIPADADYFNPHSQEGSD